MTPKQRHMDEANKIVDAELAAYYVSPRPGFQFDLRESTARAGKEKWRTRCDALTTRLTECGAERAANEGRTG